MSAYGGSYGDHKSPRKEQSSFDRDRELEARFSFAREPDVTVLQYVSQQQAELTREFREWRSGNRLPGETILQGLVRWEEGRFGAPLFESAHGLLWFRVRQALTAHARPIEPPEPRRPELDEATRLRRFDEAVGKIAREKALP